MNQEALDVLAGRVRAFLAVGHYSQAQATFEAYCKTLAGTLEGLPPGDPAIARLEDEWHRFLNETRRRVMRDRAHAGLRLSRLLAGPQIYQERPQPWHTWECMG
jgi:hypothetical protein